jgi:tetratricopeptide (TPR) repeat protein
LAAEGAQLDEAIELYTESLELNRRLGDTVMVGIELHNIGHVELHRGNVDAAERCFAECAQLRDDAKPYDTAMTHLDDAALAFQRGDQPRASELLARTGSTLDAAGIVLDPDDAFEVDWLRERLS